MACLAEAPAASVVLLHYDEPLPSPFLAFDEPEASSEVLALLLATEGPGIPLSLGFDPAPAGATRSASPAQEFVGLLETPGEAERISVGERLAWRWRRHATQD